ncbi:serine hydrolase [Hahella sp. HN01]|uniref:serine hydrolase domain-containing protein n=1 Tax=Hahella sp. HN01 TaxID=2847262 RepID=UPI001C1EE676|nr:serine hydrolase domain-containing protein [Hahella sp. HN01]MBU6955378.1 beta-lactamase family protein [Hahella sp. HN01]
MILIRRSLLKMGIAGLIAPQIAFAKSTQDASYSFDEWREKFESSIQPRMHAAHVAGTSVAIMSRDCGTLYSSSFGYADIGKGRKLTVDTPMHLASISKLFTATALVQLFERERLDLDSDVNEYIDFAVRNPYRPHDPITPRHLLTHTSSISDEGHGDPSYEGDPRQSLDSFLKNYLVKGGDAYTPEGSYSRARPGQKWDYCNVAMALAGYVIECVSGQPFASYVERNVLEPLGIWNAHWYLRQFDPDILAKPYDYQNGDLVELPQQGYPDVPAGMLRCSVADLSKAVRAMIGGENSRDILSPRAPREMLRRQVKPTVYPYQGLGWILEGVNERQFVGHSGRDLGAANILVLTEDLSHGVFVLINSELDEDGEAFRSALVEELLVGASLAV